MFRFLIAGGIIATVGAILGLGAIIVVIEFIIDEWRRRWREKKEKKKEGMIC